ncbi:4-phosphoerythronate dehydrogenase [Thiomicrospira cyclica]|uniref:Erythronate-4-phosphate dehydrogenase n=1 Tax=Thiomicrospira cyclica (strain DSM 14477 / JCM 11371 / ALM1) TaxID=717773 RepID=F6DA36_THICA|nr:4-phosphoerythronate dehydrogenase [Thiomicrospira cyclica]AEG32167.1 Erythronate-4-phosphate dehydrogenase [Thiomicrospira cyclica ALM1]
MTRRIVIDDALPLAQQMFSHLGDIMLLPGRAIDAQAVADADALVVRSRTQVNQALLANSRVQFVGSSVVGLDHVDQAWLAQQGIHFYSAQGCNANSVSEYIITLAVEQACLRQQDFAQVTLGVVGVGHVGKRVVAKAQALGFQLLLNDPPRQARGEACEAGSWSDLDTLLNQADIITLHTPLTLDDEHPSANLLNADRLAKLRADQVLINAARGGIVDEQAWCDSAMTTKLVDCWQDEPKINSKLFHQADMATPHIAGHSYEAKLQGGLWVYQQLCAFWGTTPQIAWQQACPSAPASLQLNTHLNSWPATLLDLLHQAYNPHHDHQRLQADRIEQVWQQFETQRRDYPIRREWTEHQVAKTAQKAWNDALQSLGFQLY